MTKIGIEFGNQKSFTNSNCFSLFLFDY